MMKRYKTNNLSEWAIILYLDINKKATRKELAETFNVDSARIGYVIRKLKDKNIIICENNHNDKRSVYYSLI
jgi:DNA-binding MarR family transcriptional regulator